MQNTQRAKQNTPEEQDKRKEKERKREEKELRKIAAAAGVRMAKAASSTAALAPVATPAEPNPTGFKKSGWASIPTVATASPPSTGSPPPARTGWASVGSSSDQPYSPSLAPDTISSAGFSTMPVISSQSRDPSLREPAKDDERQLHQPAPAFRTGGWSSMDSTTRIPPSIPSVDVPASAMANTHRQPEHLPPVPASATPEAVLVAVPSPLPVPPHSHASVANPRADAAKPLKSKKEREAEIRENSRSGWQSFQKSGRRK